MEPVLESYATWRKLDKVLMIMCIKVHGGGPLLQPEIPTAGNRNILQNELKVYRGSNIMTVYCEEEKKVTHSRCAFSFRSLNHPNLLSLLGIVARPHSVVLIMNYVRGRWLHQDGHDKVC